MIARASKSRLFGIMILTGLVALVAGTSPVRAIDPPYQGEMERLSEVLGSLYFLQPLCNLGHEDWRAQAAELIELDKPDDDRRQRLIGAFNTGYESYARSYRTCTPSALAAMEKLLNEAETSARDIHTRFAE